MVSALKKFDLEIVQIFEEVMPNLYSSKINPTQKQKN